MGRVVCGGCYPARIIFSPVLVRCQLAMRWESGSGDAKPTVPQKKVGGIYALEQPDRDVSADAANQLNVSSSFVGELKVRLCYAKQSFFFPLHTLHTN